MAAPRGRQWEAHEKAETAAGQRYLCFLRHLCYIRYIHYIRDNGGSGWPARCAETATEMLFTNVAWGSECLVRPRSAIAGHATGPSRGDASLGPALPVTSQTLHMLHMLHMLHTSGDGWLGPAVCDMARTCSCG